MCILTSNKHVKFARQISFSFFVLHPRVLVCSLFLHHLCRHIANFKATSSCVTATDCQSVEYSDCSKNVHRLNSVLEHISAHVCLHNSTQQNKTKQGTTYEKNYYYWLKTLCVTFATLEYLWRAVLLTYFKQSHYFNVQIFLVPNALSFMGF